MTQSTMWPERSRESYPALKWRDLLCCFLRSPPHTHFLKTLLSHPSLLTDIPMLSVDSVPSRDGIYHFTHVSQQFHPCDKYLRKTTYVEGIGSVFKVRGFRLQLAGCCGMEVRGTSWWRAEELSLQEAERVTGLGHKITFKGRHPLTYFIEASFLKNFTSSQNSTTHLKTNTQAFLGNVVPLFTFPATHTG